MTYIPDARAEYIEPLTSKEVRQKNPYYEGNLSEENKKALHEFDLTLQLVDGCFDNAEDFVHETDIDVRPSDIRTVIKAFHEWLKDYMETQRDEYVVSMIDWQEDDAD